MTDKPSVLRDTDDDARRLARRLIHTAPHVALAVIDPDSGFPSASRVLVATDSDGTPVILVSGLSTHTKALMADPRCSLLAGEQSKGDPLAYPRITVLARATRLEKNDPVRARLRRRFVLRHPKAELYIDFPDFAFFRLEPVSASLNGGFARAYALTGADLLNAHAATAISDHDEERMLQSLTNAFPDAAARLAKRLSLAAQKDWRICGLDANGIDIAAADNMSGGRHEVEDPQNWLDSLKIYMENATSTSREI